MNKEYYFEKAYEALMEGHIITSKETERSFKVDKSDAEEFKLKVKDPLIDSWVNTDYISYKEMFRMWHITK